MRAFDRDLIREGHYGQRSCEPHQQAEHMAAPTNPCIVKINLANREPSTHGTKQTFRVLHLMSALEGKPEIGPMVLRALHLLAAITMICLPI